MSFVKVKAITGWRSLALWSLAFAGFAFTVVSAASIGPLVAPFALIITVIVALWARSWPEAQLGGFFIGPGVICLLVAFLNRDYVPCPSMPVTIVTPGGYFSCGGFDPLPWLVAGSLLVAAGLAIYYLLKSVKSKIISIGLYPDDPE